MTNGFDGVDISMLKLFVLLHTYISVILSENETGLHNGLDLLECYCDRWKLQVNISKTKSMICKIGGRSRANLYFTCKSSLGARSQTNNNFVYGELGRYPLRIRRMNV